MKTIPNVAKRDRETIANLASAVFDNGRRGFPRQGCDCVQCFGYCMIDRDAMVREASAHRKCDDFLPSDFYASGDSYE